MRQMKPPLTPRSRCLGFGGAQGPRLASRKACGVNLRRAISATARTLNIRPASLIQAWRLRSAAGLDEVEDFEALALGHRWPREADLNLEEELDIFMPLTSSHKRFRLSRTLAPTLVLNGDGVNPVSLFPLSLLHWEDALAGVGRRRMQIVKVYERISDLARQLVPSVVKLTYMAPRRDIFKELPIPRPWKGNIALRDLYKCSYCGTPLLQWDMTLDHVIPRSRGGDNSWENLASCCFACNQRKGDLMPSELQKVDMSLRAWPREPTCIDLQRNYLDLLPKYVVEQWTHILRAPMDEATRIVERRTGLMREHRAPPIVCSEIQQHVARGGL